ncbi:MAG: hypothetical protein WCK34_04530 [Bacteroidota bacterium]
MLKVAEPCNEEVKLLAPTIMAAITKCNQCWLAYKPTGKHG